MKKSNYEVGYKKPPKETRFTKGQSGNKKGRPKASKNTYNILADELSQTISLKENGKEIKLTKRQAMLRHLVNKSVQGDIKAMFFIFNHLLELDQKEELKTEMSKMLMQDDQDILKRFLESNANKSAETSVTESNSSADFHQLDDSNNSNFNN